MNILTFLTFGLHRAFFSKAGYDKTNSEDKKNPNRKQAIIFAFFFFYHNENQTLGENILYLNVLYSAWCAFNLPVKLTLTLTGFD